MVQYRRLRLMEREGLSRMLAKNTCLNPCNCDRMPLLRGIDTLSALHYHQNQPCKTNLGFLTLPALILFHPASSSILAVFLLPDSLIADIRSGA